MSYTIVFETKIVKLNNGDIIHFDLSGCNNDTEGRDRHDFHGTYYTADEWKKEIEKWESMPKYDDDSFDLRIGNRYCQWNDYGKHLRTMTKRAKSFADFKASRSFWGSVYDGITYYPENGKPVDYSGKEADDIADEIVYGRIKGGYRIRTHSITTEEECINALKNNKEAVRFYVGKEWR